MQFSALDLRFAITIFCVPLICLLYCPLIDIKFDEFGLLVTCKLIKQSSFD